MLYFLSMLNFPKLFHLQTETKLEPHEVKTYMSGHKLVPIHATIGSSRN